ncbi:hypothetical protein PsorP6_006868 [Peronosclerospora sorghi]|uniref:Uncharacterized protein n=1 Tax=Peronosclerospora sorghi TaxID=230839 RepID=A0ACC0W9S5_9STRA|nr:hypothetical protein PsorP6_006868 [Peronosclerospora sorghi]
MQSPRHERENHRFKFPYKAERGKIGGLPISLGNDEQWTRALKYMLTHQMATGLDLEALLARLKKR